MKKTYQKVSMQIIEINTQALLMMSTLGTTYEKSGNLARDYDFDDDEE